MALKFLFALLLALCLTALSAFVSDLVSTFGKDTIAPLVAAIGVAGAAFMAVWGQWKTTDRETEKRSRTARAARAVLPGVLAELQTYLRNCVDLLVSTYPSSGGREIQRDKFVVPKIPSDALKILRDVIEHSEPKVGDFFARTIRILQVQNSRMSRDRSELFDASATFLTQHECDSMLTDAIVLYAFFDAAYAYARNRSDEAPTAPITNDFRRAARLLGIHDEQYEFVHKKLLAAPSVLDL